LEAAKRVAKNTGILYARMAITVFISLYSTRLILSALGVADFGLFNVVGGVISMLGFLNSSMAAATQRFMSFAQGAGDLEKVKRIFNMSSLLHWGIAVLVFILLESAGYFFFHGVLNIAPDRLEVAKLIFQFMVISTLFTVISIPYEAVITSHENMMVYAVLGVIEAVLKLGIAFYITYTGLDHLVMYGVLMAALSICILVIKRIFCHRVYEECQLQIRQYYDKPLLKEMGGFAGWEILASTTSMLSFYGQAIIVNIFFGTLVNSAQAIGSQISGQLGVFAVTVTNALNPLIFRSEGSGNRELMLNATYLGTRISFFLLTILYIPFIVDMPFILKTWLITVPSHSILFCRLILISNLIEQFYIVLNTSIASTGNIKEYKIISSIILSLPIFFSFVLFTLGFPPQTIYCVFIISKVLLVLNAVYFSKLKFNLSIKYFLVNIVSIGLLLFILSLFMTFLSVEIVENETIKFFISFTVGPLTYLILTWFMGIDIFERVFIKRKLDFFIKKNIRFQKKPII
jgi:O-antigen/teichoic acid export membrane protein